MFQVIFTTEASNDLDQLRKFDQRKVTRAIRVQLTHEPDRSTTNRKRLKPNALAEWELRVEEFRVFYDVDSASSKVNIIAIGRKLGSNLYVHGEEYTL